MEGWARVLPTCLNYAKFPDAAAASDYASGNDGFFIALAETSGVIIQQKFALAASNGVITSALTVAI